MHQYDYAIQRIGMSVPVSQSYGKGEIQCKYLSNESWPMYTMSNIQQGVSAVSKTILPIHHRKSCYVENLFYLPLVSVKTSSQPNFSILLVEM